MYVGRHLKSISGLKLHQRACRNKTLLAPSEVEVTLDSNNHKHSSSITNVPLEEEQTQKKTINEPYEKMVFGRKLIFQLPSNREGKQFVNEITSLIDAWSFDSASKIIAIKNVMVLPNLILQKSSTKASNEINKACMERRFKLWKDGNVKDLLSVITIEVKNTLARLLLTSSNKKYRQSFCNFFLKIQIVMY